MLAQILNPNDVDRNFVQFQDGDEVVPLINNLGGLSVLELSGIVAEVVNELKSDYGMAPVRILAGTYLTSLNGLGFSVSLLRLCDTGLGSGKSTLDILDLPAEACGWVAPISKETWESKPGAVLNGNSVIGEAVIGSKLTVDVRKTYAALKCGLQRVIETEPEITQYDTLVGDGDCGIGLKRGPEAILSKLHNGPLIQDAVVLLQTIVSVVEESMDGTSGAVYAIFLNALTAALREKDTERATPAQMGVQTLIHLYQRYRI